WERGLMVVDVDLLCDLLQAKKIWAQREQALLEKEGVEVRLEGWSPRPGERDPSMFVDPRPALKAFGGAIEVTTDEHGDAIVKLIGAANTAQAAQTTALCADQLPEYRLRCLDAIQRNWPELLRPVCEELLNRPREKATIRAWSVAYLAQGADEQQARALYDHLVKTGGAWQELVEATLQTRSDDVLRGATLVLAAGNPLSTRNELITRISKCNPWWEGTARARNCGLVLRLIKAPGSVETLVGAIRGYGDHQPAEDAMIALGCLGDDAAIPFLTGIALADGTHTRDMNGAAAKGLACLGTPAGLAACADVARRASNGNVRLWAMQGIGVAMGLESPHSFYDPAAPPDWARTLTVAEATELCRPPLEQMAVDPNLDLAGRAKSILRSVPDGATGG
ncbi:MAG TPA: hypothetical protein VM283_07500, partial [Armatimonadota bacterium]|nr:hypothetical protein [Armatimonadota bacterium]